MTVVRFTDGRRVDVADALCEFRPCFRFGLDKGTFVAGRGYTSYYDKPRPVCFQRHLNGCPAVGVHLKCGGCHATIGEARPLEANRDRPAVCPECGSGDLYWLQDVLPDPQPCCGSPSVAKPRAGTVPWRQRCRSCGTWLSGERLEVVRRAVSPSHEVGS